MLCSRVAPAIILGLSCLTDALPYNPRSDTGATGTTSNGSTRSPTPWNLTIVNLSSQPVVDPDKASLFSRADAAGGESKAGQGEHLLVKLVINLSLDQLYGVSVGVPQDTTLYVTVRSDRDIGSITAHDENSREVLARTTLGPGTRQASLVVDPEENNLVHFTVYLVGGYGAPMITVVSRKRAPPMPEVSLTEPSGEPSREPSAPSGAPSGARRRLIWRDSSVSSPAAATDEKEEGVEAAPAQIAPTVAGSPPSDQFASIEESPKTSVTSPRAESPHPHILHPRSSSNSLVPRGDVHLFPGERPLLRLPITNSCRLIHKFVVGVTPGNLIRIRIAGQKSIVGILARAVDRKVQLARFPLGQDAVGRARPTSVTLDVDPRGSAIVRLNVEFYEYNGSGVLLVTEYNPSLRSAPSTGNATDIGPTSALSWGKEFDFLIDGSLSDELFDPQSCEGAPSSDPSRPSRIIRPRSPRLSPRANNERLLVRLLTNPSRRKGHTFNLGVLPGKALRVEVSSDKRVASIEVRSADNVDELAHYTPMDPAENPRTVTLDVPPHEDLVRVFRIIFVETLTAAAITVVEYDPPEVESPEVAPPWVMADDEFDFLFEPPPGQVNHPAAAAAQAVPPPVNQPGALPAPDLRAPSAGIPLPQAPPSGPSVAADNFVAVNPHPDIGTLPRIWPTSWGRPPPGWPLVRASSQPGEGGMPAGASDPPMPQGLVSPLVAHANAPSAGGQAPGATPPLGSQMLAPGAPPPHNPPAAPAAPLVGPAWGARLPVNPPPAPGAPGVGPAWGGVPSFNQPGAAPGVPPVPNPPAVAGAPQVGPAWSGVPSFDRPGAAPGVPSVPNPPAVPGAPPVQPSLAAPPAFNLAAVDPSAPLPQHLPTAPGAPQDDPFWGALPAGLTWGAPPPISPPAAGGAQNVPADPNGLLAGSTWGGAPPFNSPAAPLTPLAGTGGGGAGPPFSPPAVLPAAPSFGNAPAVPGAWLPADPRDPKRRKIDSSGPGQTLHRRSPPSFPQVGPPGERLLASFTAKSNADQMFRWIATVPRHSVLRVTVEADGGVTAIGAMDASMTAFSALVPLPSGRGSATFEVHAQDGGDVRPFVRFSRVDAKVTIVMTERAMEAGDVAAGPAGVRTSWPAEFGPPPPSWPAPGGPGDTPPAPPRVDSPVLRSPLPVSHLQDASWQQRVQQLREEARSKRLWEAASASLPHKQSSGPANAQAQSPDDESSSSNPLHRRTPLLQSRAPGERTIVDLEIRSIDAVTWGLTVGVLPGKSLRIKVKADKPIVRMSARPRYLRTLLADVAPILPANGDRSSTEATLDVPPGDGSSDVRFSVVFAMSYASATITVTERDVPPAGGPHAPVLPSRVPKEAGEPPSVGEPLRVGGEPPSVGGEPPSMARQPSMPAASNANEPPNVQRPVWLRLTDPDPGAADLPAAPPSPAPDAAPQQLDLPVPDGLGPAPLVPPAAQLDAPPPVAQPGPPSPGPAPLSPESAWQSDWSSMSGSDPESNPEWAPSGSESSDPELSGGSSMDM